MPAEPEEIVIGTDPVEAQEIGEESTDNLLLRSSRSTARDDFEVRNRQSLTVDLPVRGQGNRVQNDPDRRNHVLGQHPRDRLPHRLHAGAPDEVTDQTPLHHRDDSITDTLDLTQTRL
ncbi:hypothetical protein PV331_45770, partial [Streptomyces sp. WI04-05B]